MCDYSLQMVKSRPAAVGDKLVVTGFVGTNSRGFASPDDRSTAVCVLPGTEIAFDKPIIEDKHHNYGSMSEMTPQTTHKHTTARFRQINIDHPHRHHDALEMPDGTTVELTFLDPGQTATVLQLPTSEQQREMQLQGIATERLEVVA